MYTYSIRLWFSYAETCGAARFDIWDRKPLCNPAHGVAERDSENTHHQVYVGAAQLADETPPTVSPLVKMQGGISVTVRVILRTQAFDSPVSNAQAKRTRQRKHRNVFLNPSCVGPRAFGRMRDLCQRGRAHSSPPAKRGKSSVACGCGLPVCRSYQSA